MSQKVQILFDLLENFKTRFLLLLVLGLNRLTLKKWFMPVMVGV
jgi:hypothetical protein